MREREKLARYNFNIRWTPGKSNIIADALTRAPIFDPEEEELTSSTIQCLADSEEMKLLTFHKCEQYNLLRAKDVLLARNNVRHRKHDEKLP